MRSGRENSIWEARRGFWADVLIGRSVLFVAHVPSTSPGDIYRANVVLTRSGRPLRVASVHNLSRSPLGDDGDLCASGHHAAYVTRAFGWVQGVTLLDMHGEPNERKPASRGAGLRSALQNFVTTGDIRGVGRTEVTFARRVSDLHEELQGDILVMAVGGDGQPLGVSLVDDRLSLGTQNAYQAAVRHVSEPPPPLARIAADAVDATLGVPVFGSTRRVLGASPELGPAPTQSFVPSVLRRLSSEAPTTSEGDGWPPPDISPQVAPARGGEGHWQAARTLRISPGAPACLYVTSIRPDSRHPEATVELVAIDTRQVDFRLVPGTYEPRSLVGIRATDRPPNDVPENRIVGAFLSDTGEGTLSPGAANPLGFVSEGRVFSPPVEGAAAVALREDGSVLFGPWRNKTHAAVHARSTRQTYDELLGGDGRVRFPLPAGGTGRKLGALGLLPTGQLVYGWTSDSHADVLREALSLSGSTYAVPFASVTTRPALAVLNEQESGASRAPTYQGAAPASWLSAPLESDAFYGVLRSPTPPMKLPPAGSDNTWAASAGPQPTPAWLPGIHATTAAYLGTPVHLTLFGTKRLTFGLNADSSAPSSGKAVVKVADIEQSDKRINSSALIATVGLGLPKKRSVRGLSIAGVAEVPLRGDSGVLVIEDGWPRVMRAADYVPSPGTDAVELPLVADEHKLRPEAREIGSLRNRNVACSLEGGGFAVASTTFDSDEAATVALLDLGCANVVGLDRGSHQPSQVYYPTLATATGRQHEGTILYALDRPLRGRAGRIVDE